MSGLGFASSAGALACPYGVTQWVTQDPAGVSGGYTGGGFAWPRFLYATGTITGNPSAAPKKEIADGTQRDARSGRLYAAALLSPSIYAPVGNTLSSAGLAEDTVVLNVGQGDTVKYLGPEDSGITVVIQNLNAAANAIIVAPPVGPAYDGWRCKIVYGAQCGGSTAGGTTGVVYLQSFWPAGSTASQRQGQWFSMNRNSATATATTPYGNDLYAAGNNPDWTGYQLSWNGAVTGSSSQIVPGSVVEIKYSCNPVSTTVYAEFRGATTTSGVTFGRITTAPPPPTEGV